MELILGITILNKASGIYGLLSIVTGHPINFLQWLFNVLALITVPFYARALANLKIKPKNGRSTSLACIVYTLDTLVGLFYTLYFTFLWFSEEGALEKRELNSTIANTVASVVTSTPIDTAEKLVQTSQSASQARELFFTFAGTILLTALRLYFNLVIISFTSKLLKQLRNEAQYGKDDDEIDELIIATGVSGKVRRFIYNLENISLQKLLDFFNH